MDGSFLDSSSATGAGTIIGVVVTIVSGAYAFIMKHKKKMAEVKADTATAGAQQTVADAQSAVYASLTSRLSQLEQDIANVRMELSTERKYSRMLDLHNRRLEIYIVKLVAMLKSNGVEVPPMDTLPDLDTST